MYETTILGSTNAQQLHPSFWENDHPDDSVDDVINDLTMTQGNVDQASQSQANNRENIDNRPQPGRSRRQRARNKPQS